MECAEFRINTIAELYAELHRELVAKLDGDDSLRSWHRATSV